MEIGYNFTKGFWYFQTVVAAIVATPNLGVATEYTNIYLNIPNIYL